MLKSMLLCTSTEKSPETRESPVDRYLCAGLAGMLTIESKAPHHGSILPPKTRRTIRKFERPPLEQGSWANESGDQLQRRFEAAKTAEGCTEPGLGQESRQR